MNIACIDWTVIGTFFATIAFIYTIYRNLKSDMRLEIQTLSQRMDVMDNRLNSIEERMFLLSTGKTLAQAILEEKMKQERMKEST